MDSERNKIIGEGTDNINRTIEKLLQEGKLQNNQAEALRKAYKISVK